MDPRRPAPRRETTRIAALTPAQALRAGYVADRLLAELRRAMTEVPGVSPLSARALARALRLDATVVQRIARATRGSESGAGVLARLPGEASLAKVFRAMARLHSGFDAEPGLAAVREFRRFVRETGGSHARLAAMIGASATGRAATADPMEAARIRRRLFEGVALTTGMSADAVVVVDVFNHSGVPGRVDLASVNAVFGNALGASAMPIVAAARVYQREEDVPAVPAVRPGDFSDDFTESKHRTMIPEFTSAPAPRLSSRREGRSVFTIVDPPPGEGTGAGTAAKFDLALGERHASLPSPLLGDDRSISLGARIRMPTRRLVHMCFMPRDMAGACTPSTGAYFWTPGSAAEPWATWYDRLPCHETLELLGEGLAQASSPGLARTGELAAFMFERLGWKAENFVGYRMSVAYPHWGAGYALMLDFAERTVSGGPSRKSLDTGA
jgi:hypothetical protein